MMQIKWAILLYGLGISGGANVIFNHALHACDKGCEITLVSIEKRDVEETSWHAGTERFRYLTLAEASKELYDVAIATEWKSAYDISLISARKYFYFVQSIESRFFYNQKSILKYMADNTYEMPLYYITEATWIKDYLRKYYGKCASLIKNGVDKKHFSINGNKIEEKPNNHIRILVEGAVSNWLKNVPKTIELCQKAGAEDIWLVTPEKINSYPGVTKVFSEIPLDRMPEIYRSCDVIVKLSLVEGMFGPPLEMFHCGGTAITYDITGAEEYLVDGINSIVVPVNDEAAVVNAIRGLLQDKERIKLLKKGAIETASGWIDWEKSSEAFWNCINNAELTADCDRDAIVKKGRDGSETYRRLEYLLGMDPYKNRMLDLNAVYEKTHKKVYLYGAGAMCRSTLILLSEYNIPIEGILVTDKQGNPNSVMGHRVYTIDEINDVDGPIIYITSDKYFSEIAERIKEHGIYYIV